MMGYSFYKIGLLHIILICNFIFKNKSLIYFNCFYLNIGDIHSKISNPLHTLTCPLYQQHAKSS
jgi:hypothetical protein